MEYIQITLCCSNKVIRGICVGANCTNLEKKTKVETKKFFIKNGVFSLGSEINLNPEFDFEYWL